MPDERKRGLLKDLVTEVENEDEPPVKRRRGKPFTKKQGDGGKQRTFKEEAEKREEEPIEMEYESGERDGEETPPLSIESMWKRAIRKASKLKKEMKEDEPEIDEMQEEAIPLSNEQQRRKTRRCIKPVTEPEEKEIAVEDDSEEKEGKEDDTTLSVRKKKKGTRRVTKSKTPIKKKKKPHMKGKNITPVPKRGRRKKGAAPALRQIQEEQDLDSKEEEEMKDVALPSTNKAKRVPKTTSNTNGTVGKPVVKVEEDVTPVMTKESGRGKAKQEGSGGRKPVVQDRRVKKAAVEIGDEGITLPPSKRKKKENKVTTMVQEFDEKAAPATNKKGKKPVNASKANEDMEREMNESPASCSTTQEKGNVASTAKISAKKSARTRAAKKNEEAKTGTDKENTDVGTVASSKANEDVEPGAVESPPSCSMAQEKRNVTSTAKTSGKKSARTRAARKNEEAKTGTDKENTDTRNLPAESGK